MRNSEDPRGDKMSKYYGPNTGEGNPFFPDEKCVDFGSQKISSAHGSVFDSSVASQNTYQQRLSNSGAIGGTMTNSTTGVSTIGAKKRGK